MTVINAAAASPGIGHGPAYVVAPAPKPSDLVFPDVDDPMGAFTAATASVSGQLEAAAARADERGLDEAAEILRAQQMMADDPMLSTEVEDKIGAGVAVGDAVITAVEDVATMLEESESEYLAARAVDVREVGSRILLVLAGVSPRDLGDITTPSVIVAHELTAADTSQLDPALVRGFVTEGGGPTGHVAVIARSLGIPAVVGAAGLVASVEDGIDVWIDGRIGEVHIGPDEEVLIDLRGREEAERVAAEADSAYVGRSISFGDRTMTIAANVGSSDDIASAIEAGADGVGLFRTEFLFLDTDRPPTEDEQVAAYTEALAGFDHPVVIRLFDIGGDKPARYLDLPEEENPFLGVRGVRLYESHRDLALTQARALLRAANAGTAWVMTPMVATIEDVQTVRAIFDDARASLESESLDHGDVLLGVMVEVPSAALNAAALARHVDFFSIGTNDLTQYTLAVDRTSGALAGYTDAADPAVLRLCDMTARAATEAGISISVCGEAGSDPALAPLFAAMGMDKLSVGSRSVNAVKRLIDNVEPEACATLLERCLLAESAGDVRRLVGETIQ